MRSIAIHRSTRRGGTGRRAMCTAALAATLLALAGCGDDGLLVVPEPQESYWFRGFATNGMDDYVYALAAYGDALVAGGLFRHAGPVYAPAVARWDGTAWHPLGGELVRDDCTVTPNCYASVRALLADGTALVAGGRFTSAGGVAACNVGRWDGTAWAAYGEGLGGMVNALAVYGGRLVAGGDFVASGSDSSVRYLAVWDGSRWTALGGGTNGIVRALLAIGEDLYAGGDFTVAGTDSCARIARWDGTRWEALGGGLGGSVTALAAWSGHLVVAGSFSTVGDPYHSGCVARWDGRYWDVVPSSFFQTNSLGTYGGDLAVGGSPNYYHPEWNGVGRWTGREWRSFGNGIRGTVNALCVLGGSLYLGGYFTNVAGVSSRYIARWDDPPAAP